jgi:hypothetical protein
MDDSAQMDALYIHLGGAIVTYVDGSYYTVVA